MSDTRENLQWLVDHRNEIQKTALDLYDLLPKDGEFISTTRVSLIRQDLVGALFCLWRGVFLAHDKKSEPGIPIKHAKDYLKKIIETNAITFGDDKNSMEWSANFYVDGAGRILAGFPSVGLSNGTPRCESLLPPWKVEDYPAQIKGRWEYNHKILKGKIEALRLELPNSKNKQAK